MRDYDATPRPEIENHWHIRELIEAQEKRAADRTYHQDRIKAAEECIKEIKDAPGKETKPFYCEICKDDFIGEAIKQVESDWTSNQNIAFYKTKCFRGHWTMRLITDRLRDRYFFKSRRIAQDRAKHANDLLQSHQTGYNLLYKK